MAGGCEHETIHATGGRHGVGAGELNKEAGTCTGCGLTLSRLIGSAAWQQTEDAGDDRRRTESQ